MVDLSKLQNGDIVHFRCGGQDYVASCTLADHEKYYYVKFEGSELIYDYWYNGHINRLEKDSMFDIIRIESPAFNWDDVKPGMAFLHKEYGTVWYVAEDFHSSNRHVVISKSIICADIIVIYRDCLTRAPEHDIEVK